MNPYIVTVIIFSLIILHFVMAGLTTAWWSSFDRSIETDIEGRTLIYFISLIVWPLICLFLLMGEVYRRTTS